MKTKKSDILLCSLFCGFLVSVLLLFLALPRQDFSEKEKRYLAEAPRLTWQNLASGQFGEEVETYLADHVPGRDFFVGLSAYYDLLSNRQVTKEVYRAEGSRLVEPPVRWDPVAAQSKVEIINNFAETIGQPVDMMLVPSAGFCLEDTIQGLANPYNDSQIIRDIYGLAGENVNTVDLIAAFTEVQDPGALFYRTDHHWTSLGAYAAYKTYMEQLGRDYLTRDAFTVESYDGFYGSTYSRSGLWLTKGENVELWNAGGDFTVTNGESEAVSRSLFYRDRLEELDKYTVYLDGNHSLVRIENPAAEGKGKLLVIRASYANCLGTFLAHSYESGVLVDLRYYKNPISELVEAEGFTDVLITYSLGNFMTDSNLIFLR